MNKFNYDNRPHKVIKFLVFSIFLISTCNKIRSATITVTVFIMWPRDSLISVSALGPVTKSWHNKPIYAALMIYSKLDTTSTKAISFQLSHYPSCMRWGSMLGDGVSISTTDY